MRIKLQQTIILSVFILLLCSPVFSAEIPAFPGAQGSAAYASGGRGGTVYKVTTLANSGAGSLRDAVSQSNRIIVFETSGWITLSSELASYADNITIAGQTSPGGIGVKGNNFRIVGTNWIITHMRFAAGAYQKDSLNIYGNMEGDQDAGDLIMLDHCSIRYGCDECANVSYNPGRVTFSHCIIGPGIGTYGDTCHDKGEHNYGFLMWDDDNYANGGRADLTIHHSYFPHNSFRNPELQHAANDTPTYDVVNNVIWDFRNYWAIEVSGQAQVNIEGNWVAGANGVSNPEGAREVNYYYGKSAVNQFYVVDNWGLYRFHDDDPIKDDWSSVAAQGATTALSTDYKAASRWSTQGISVARTPMNHDYALEVVANVGATKPVRDSVDSDLVDDFTYERKGYVGFSEAVYPTFSNLSPPTDSDNDGMADSWETDNGINVGSNDSAGDQDGDGYTNIEEYLHYLAGASGPSQPPAPPENLRIEL